MGTEVTDAMTFEEWCASQSFGKALTLIDLRNLWDHWEQQLAEREQVTEARYSAALLNVLDTREVQRVSEVYMKLRDERWNPRAALQQDTGGK